MKIREWAELFGALSSEKRLKILCFIREKKRVCACEIVKFIGDSQPSVSKHLSILKYLRLVFDEREGNSVYYSLSLPPEVQELIDKIAEENKEVLQLENECD